MGTSLNGLTPATTYTGLLKFGDNSSITTSLKAISDGAGNDTMLELSTTALQVGGSTGMFWDNTNKRLGVGETTPTARVQIKGEGATSSTIALRVQNSGGSDLLKVDNDGSVRVNQIKGLNYTNNTISFGANLELLNFNSLTAAKIGVNAPVPSATQFIVKGSGSTSATTSLLVQNSSGTELLKVQDDGIVSVPIEAQLGSIRLTSDKIISYQIRIQPISGGLCVSAVASSAVTSAILQADSTTKGFLPPRMTTTQKNAIASPASGLMVYDTTTNKLCCYNGTSWNDLF